MGVVGGVSMVKVSHTTPPSHDANNSFLIGFIHFERLDENLK